MSSTTFILTVSIFIYKSLLTPNPGPVGGSDNDVSPPLGSDANLWF